jgi:hypothetical protein
MNTIELMEYWLLLVSRCDSPEPPNNLNRYRMQACLWE